jgi:hypothetical protein
MKKYWQMDKAILYSTAFKKIQLTSHVLKIYIPVNSLKINLNQPCYFLYLNSGKYLSRDKADGIPCVVVNQLWATLF